MTRRPVPGWPHPSHRDHRRLHCRSADAPHRTQATLPHPPPVTAIVRVIHGTTMTNSRIGALGGWVHGPPDEPPAGWCPWSDGATGDTAPSARGNHRGREAVVSSGPDGRV